MNDIVSLMPTNEVEKREFHKKLFASYQSMIPALGRFESLCNAKYCIEDEIKKMKENNGKNKEIIVAVILVFSSAFVPNAILSTIYFYAVILGLIYYHAVYKKKKRNQLEEEIKGKENEIQDIQTQIDSCIDSLRPRLVLVPQGYRTTEALNFLCNAYSCGKAESIKEAMLQYDEDCHRRRLEEGNIEIMNRQQQILNNQQTIKEELTLDLMFSIMNTRF